MTTPNLSLSELTANQAQPHVTVNASIRMLDALVQMAVLAQQNSPPGSPADGQRYIVGDTPTGAWVGHEADVAWYNGTAWQYLTPEAGWLAWVVNEAALYVYNTGSPSGWQLLVAL